MDLISDGWLLVAGLLDEEFYDGSSSLCDVASLVSTNNLFVVAIAYCMMARCLEGEFLMDLLCILLKWSSYH